MKHAAMWLAFAALTGSGAVAAQSKDAPGWTGPFIEVVQPLHSKPLRDLPPLEGFTGLPTHIEDQREPPPPWRDRVGWHQNDLSGDPLVGKSENVVGRTPSPTFTAAGQGNTCGCSPPDVVGAAGPNHYVQMVNATALGIYNKTTGALLSPAVQFNTLWPVGASCRSSTDGDPVVTYDWLANRWVLSQFSTGNGVCVAVSQTNDPTGAYHLYEFTTPEFPDYFKIGAWSDAYYMGSNENSYSAYALNRSAMLSGAAATSIRFTGQTNFIMPATLTGTTTPPAGSPGIFYTFKDDAFHGGGGVDRLEFYHFVADFVTPANSSFALAQSLTITTFTYTVCGFFNLNCIPQGGTTRTVDAVSEWPMWQLQYRNDGGTQRMVGNFTVDVGSDRAGVRWFQVGKSGSTYSLIQEGTFAPADGLHRFMGSIGQDRCGNIALGYNASSASESPSIRYATRAASDPLGTLQSEVTMIAGGGSQTSSNRWGDYSALSLDPSDQCTFWMTGEYYTANSGNGWATRIGKFTMPGCQVASCGPADGVFSNGFE